MSAQAIRDAIASGVGVALLILAAVQWPRRPRLRRWWHRVTHERVLRSHYKGR